MTDKKFKLNPNLKRKLEALDSKLTRKLVGGRCSVSDSKRNKSWIPPIESDCGKTCVSQCEETCGSLLYKE